MIGHLRVLNPVFALFGRKVTPTYMGQWYPRPDGKGIYRSVFQVGWRWACLDEKDGETELVRFIARHRIDIDKAGQP